MLRRYVPVAILAALFAQSASEAQHRLTRSSEPPEYITRPGSILHWWNCLGAHRNVTHEYPTDYQIGGVYRLRQDVIVERGGTSSVVSKYWIGSSPELVEEQKEDIRRNREAKRRETRVVLAAGTRMRFEQIWLEGNFETGIYAQPYAQVLDGTLQGKRLCIYFIVDSDIDSETHRQHCCVNPKYLEVVAE